MTKRKNQIVKKSTSKNLAKTSIFKKNDLVFAKMRSYCAWPAKIVSIRNSSVEVYFFGTHDSWVIEYFWIYICSLFASFCVFFSIVYSFPAAWFQSKVWRAHKIRVQYNHSSTKTFSRRDTKKRWKSFWTKNANWYKRNKCIKRQQLNQSWFQFVQWRCEAIIVPVTRHYQPKWTEQR